MKIWKPLVGECLHCVKEPTNEVDKMLLLWFILILTVKKKWLAMCNRKSPWWYIYFYLFPIALWTSFQLRYVHYGGEYRLETSGNFHFSGPEKAIKLAKKDWRKLKRNCKWSSRGKCIQTSYKKCLLLPVIGLVHYWDISSRG